MEYNEIRNILEKYWEGESSLAEEAQLRDFFSRHDGDLPADLREVAPLFAYFHAAGEKEEMPELFTDEPAPWEKPTATIVRPFWYGWMKYAAVLLMAAGLGYSIFSYQQKRQVEETSGDMAFTDTYSDPKVAYKETQRALKLLSKNLNTGKEQMEKLSYFHEATQMVKGEKN